MREKRLGSRLILTLNEVRQILSDSEPIALLQDRIEIRRRDEEQPLSCENVEVIVRHVNNTVNWSPKGPRSFRLK
jgi:hypothetical protein